jgi:hypothetical protein
LDTQPSLDSQLSMVAAGRGLVAATAADEASELEAR